jgi:YHS domain-containing protein
MSEVKENRYQRQNSRDPSMFNTMDGQITSQMSGDPSQNNGMAAVTMGGVFGEDSSFGLEGYCPVSLVTKKTWAVGQEAYSVKHRGRIYQCVSEEARTEFLQAPDRYSPVLSGYDLVHFLETGELVAGKREHGCEYLGRVFVFMNAANKLHFDTHAAQYAQNITPAMGLERIATGIQAPSMQR